MASPSAVAAVGSPQRSVERLFQFSLLGMVASGYLAIAGSGYLDIPTLVLVAAALVARALVVLGVLRVHLSTHLINAVTIAYVGFYPLDYLFISQDFLPATVHVVFFLAITKIFTATTERDFSYVKVIAFLELVAASLLSANLNFFVSLALFLVFAVATFTASEIRRAATSPIRVARSGFRRMPLRLSLLSVFITLGILSITAGLFFVLPRTAGAAFQHLISDRYHLPGFSNQITLGQIGAIKRDSTPVMHVRFLYRSKDAPMPDALKWRGMALGSFDGRRWFNEPAPADVTIVAEGGAMTRLLEDQDRPPEKNASRLAYEVHVSDIDTDVLFFAGVPEAVNVRAPFIKRSVANSYKAPFASAGGLTYIAQSFFESPDSRTAPRELLSPELRRQYLELPRLDPRIPALARQWTDGLSDDEDRALAIQGRLRRDYEYTLDLLSAPVRDPLADFLFERKKGHCEYFASAMAVMLRTIGIPSRVVTGFQSGVYNPISGLQLIRSSDAHSWVEAYLPTRGWTTFDPTPPGAETALASVWTKLLLYFDAAETFWQDWVLNYDKDHQLTLAIKNSNRTMGWLGDVTRLLAHWRASVSDFLRRYGAPFAAALIIIALLILYGPAVRKAWNMRRRFKMVQRGVVEISDATLLYSRMLHCLERRGIEKPAWLTPSEFERLVPQGELGNMVRELTQLYYELRFGGRREAGPRMITLLAQLERR